MKTKTMRKAMISSIIALVLCFAMLIGTTYAWFTDSVASSGNIIKSGTLDIDLEVLRTVAGATADDPSTQEYVSIGTDASPIFNYELWEPGYTEWANVRVINKGTLALKYTMKITADAAVSPLCEVIDVYYAPSEVAKPATRDLSGLTKIGTLKDALAGTVVINDTLIPGENDTDYATIALKMQESAGNEYQNLDIGGAFTFIILATQYTYEEDSFDDQYDAAAEYDSSIMVLNPVQFSTLLTSFNNNELANEPAVVSVAAGTYSAPLEIEQFPNDEQHNASNSGYVANIGNADANIITLEANGEVVVTDELTIHGAGNSAKSGYEYLQQSEAGVVIDGFTFQGELQEGDVDTVLINLVESANNITFKNCTFKNQTHIKIGEAGGKTAGKVVFENCTFDKAACFSGYWYELIIKDCTGLVDSGHGKGLINQSGSGLTTVENCTFDVGSIAYFVRTSANGSTTNFSGCTFTGTPALIANLRGTDQTVTFTGCTLNGAQIPDAPNNNVDATDTITIA